MLPVVYGQQALVKGKIQLSTGKPLAYAMLALYEKEGDQLVKGSLSDSTGAFEFTAVPFGEYSLYVYARSKQFPKIALYTFSIDSLHPQLELGVLQVEAERLGVGDYTLEAVEIKARKPLLEQKIDHTRVNLGDSPLARGNSMLEVMKKLPGIQVLANGQIKLLGSLSVRIYIDGKGKPLSMQEAIGLLSGMSAENVESIEIYPNPPARFDASSTSVINILTKKKKMYSNVDASYGQNLFPLSGDPGWDYYNLRAGANLYFSFRNKINISALLNANQRHEFSSMKETYFLSELTRETHSNTFFKPRVLLANLRAQFNLNARNELLLQTQFLGLTTPRSARHENTIRSGAAPQPAFSTSFNSQVEDISPQLLLNYLHYFDQ
ncbi:MAG: TonB-dependent receptor, partial [Bacteroidetes bacterium]